MATNKTAAARAKLAEVRTADPERSTPESGPVGSCLSSSATQRPVSGAWCPRVTDAVFPGWDDAKERATPGTYNAPHGFPIHCVEESKPIGQAGRQVPLMRPFQALKRNIFPSSI